MPIEGKQLYIGGEPITLIQNNRFVAVDPIFVSEGPVYQFRNDPYSASLQLAIPGSEFSSLGMTNWYDDVSAEIRGTGTSYTANPTGSVAEFTEYTADTKWADYDSSMKVQDNGSWGAIPTADFSIGTQNFVLEGWLWMDERFNKPPYWKVGLRDSSYNISLEMGFPGTGTTDWKSRIMINGQQYFSSNTNISFNLNQWYHIAFVRSSGNLYTYIDGTRYTNGTDSSSITTGGTTRVMRGENVTNDGTDGAWQDFRFYVGTDKGYNTSTIVVPPSMISEQGEDDDAAAFLTAANIQDSTQQNAVNQLVIDLKDAGIWDKLDVIYPFVGGTADTHKWNLKDPRDSDDAYRLTFFNSPTHNSDGVEFDGVSEYANTHFQPSTDFSTGGLNSNHVFASYFFAASGDDGTDWGIQHTAGNNFFQGGVRTSANKAYGRNMSSTFTEIDNSSLVYVYGQNRNSSTEYDLNLGKTKTAISSNSSKLPPLNVYLGARNQNTAAGGFNNRGFNMWAVGAGLTDTEWDAWVDANEAFQTTLGRNV